MHWPDKVHKQGTPHIDTHSITWPHYSTTIPTATLWLWNNVQRHACYGVQCGISCLCTLSASAFIEPSLQQLDFFLEIFYGDLFLDTNTLFVKYCSLIVIVIHY